MHVVPMLTVEKYESVAARTFTVLNELGFPMPDIEDVDAAERKKWASLVAKDVAEAKAKSGSSQPDFKGVADQILTTLSLAGFSMPDLDGKGTEARRWATDALANILAAELGYDGSAY